MKLSYIIIKPTARITTKLNYDSALN